MDARILKTRSKVIDAATSLLVDSGPRAVTVDAVVERSGVAKSTIYRHWESRDDLLHDVMRTNMPEAGPARTDLGFSGAIRAFVHDHVAAMLEPEWARVMPALLFLRVHEPEIAELSDEDRSAKLAVLEEILQAGAEEGQNVKNLDPGEVAFMLLGPLVLALLAEPERVSLDFGDRLVDQFLASVHPIY